jgi:hypothetical protein
MTPPTFITASPGSGKTRSLLSELYNAARIEQREKDKQDLLERFTKAMQSFEESQKKDQIDRDKRKKTAVIIVIVSGQHVDIGQKNDGTAG